MLSTLWKNPSRHRF